MKRHRNDPGRALAMAAMAAVGAIAAPPAGSQAIPAGSEYVAMGSSFASGPMITTQADGSPDRCMRSADNYPHQLARKRGLKLIDVSCAGATTQGVLGAWRGLPAQIDALTPATRLVTITIGGNDVGFAGGLLTASCAAVSGAVPASVTALCDGVRRATGNAGVPNTLTAAPGEAEWASLEAGLDMIARLVRQRAPGARLVFVDYVSILPATGLCAATPLGEDAARRARQTADRLARTTAAAAHRAGAGLIQASKLSRGHDACAKQSWATPFTASPGSQPIMPYHPNLAGMTAITAALDTKLGH